MDRRVLNTQHVGLSTRRGTRRGQPAGATSVHWPCLTWWLLDLLAGLALRLGMKSNIK